MLLRPSQVLDTQIAKLTAAEQEELSLRLCDGEGRQQLLTTKGVSLGGSACPVSSLFFDEYAALLSLLQLPGNAQYGRRVVQIENVHKNTNRQ